MKKFEYALPVEPESTRDALWAAGTFLKRTQIEDVYFENAASDLVRLRRQDGVARLSCTRQLTAEGLEDHGETIVTNFAACREVLRLMGYGEVETVRLTRDTWRRDHYSLHLDRVAGIGSFLVLECQTDGLPEVTLKNRARRLLKSLKLNQAEEVAGLEAKEVDKNPALAYPVPIVA